MLYKTIVACAAAIALACAGAPIVESDCPAIENFAILVEVHDSATGADIVDGATLTATDGSYIESVTGRSTSNSLAPGLISVAPGRPGTYNLRITRPGYQDWHQAGVRVDRRGCTVETVRVNAALVRL